MKNTLEGISFDDMAYALADVQRRNLLVSLLAHNPQDETPAVLGDSESETDAVERLVTMQHTHLPKLADYGFIEWDEETHEVRKGSKFEQIRPLLELLENHEDELPDDWV